MRWLLVGVGLLALLCVSAYAFLARSLPDDPDRLQSPVRSEVRVHYDAYRRPFVRAESVEDAFFAQGWLHARERLWQMELLRRAGRGRLAEVLGEGMLETDIELWRVGVPQLAEHLSEHSSARTQRLVRAYVSGVNHALGDLQRPPEFLLAGIELSEWTALDVYAVGALTAFESGRNYSNELLRLALSQAFDEQSFEIFLPRETAGYPYVLDDADGLNAALERADRAVAARQQLLAGLSLGSNGWAVSPSRSATGNALFAFDSHDAFSMPNLLYEVHLFHEAGSVRGWSVPGLAGVINGYNDFLAWGFTNIGDSQDLFIEPSAAGVRREQVQIPVRGQPPHALEIVHSPHGPLISHSPPLALSWSGHRTGALGMDALYDMNLAGSWPEFADALDRFAAPSANVTYADVDGRIVFRTVGLLPVRSEGNGLVPLAGAGWKGFVSPEDLPMQVNPSKGFVAAANARVHAGTPLVSADNAPGYRMRRLLARLTEARTFDVEDMRALQLDRYNGQAALLLPALMREVDVDPVLSRWAEAPVSNPGSEAAVLFERWYALIASEVFLPALPEGLAHRLLRASYVLNHALDRLILHDESSPWWRGERQQILQRAYDEAGSQARGDALADVQRLVFRHEMSGAFPGAGALFDRQHAGAGGGNASLHRARHRYTDLFAARGGATVRSVIDMRSPPRAYSVIPGGQSGHPLSAHYDDQLEAYASGRLLPAASTPEAAGPVTTTLTPTMEMSDGE